MTVSEHLEMTTKSNSSVTGIASITNVMGFGFNGFNINIASTESNHNRTTPEGDGMVVNDNNLEWSVWVCERYGVEVVYVILWRAVLQCAFA